MYKEIDALRDEHSRFRRKLAQIETADKARGESKISVSSAEQSLEEFLRRQTSVPILEIEEFRPTTNH